MTKKNLYTNIYIEKFFIFQKYGKLVHFMRKLKIGFIGFGLIGGSIAKALRIKHISDDITAYDYYVTRNDGSRNPNLLQALNDKTLDNITTSLEDFKDRDIIYLCAPVKTNVSYLEKLKNIVNDSCIITDVGSVKGDIHTAATELDMNLNFVGGHPMAGSEKTGYSNSCAAIIENAYYIITSDSSTPKEKIETLKKVTSSIGSLPISVDYHKHDEYVAAISHVPHIVAVSLVNMVRENDDDGVMKLIAAGGFKDITRIGSSSPEMWENICLNNKTAILDYLEKFRDKIDLAYEYISNNDGESIKNIFESSKNYRDSIGN